MVNSGWGWGCWVVYRILMLLLLTQLSLWQACGVCQCGVLDQVVEPVAPESFSSASGFIQLVAGPVMFEILELLYVVS